MVGRGCELGDVLLRVDRADSDDWSGGLGGRAERKVALETPVTLRAGRRRSADGELDWVRKSGGVGVEGDDRGHLGRWALERRWNGEHSGGPEEGSSW